MLEEPACRAEDICTEELGTAGGDVRTCLMGLPVSLNTIMQKPNEFLHIYVSRYSRLQTALCSY